MAAASHLKLGILVLAGVVAVTAIVFGLGLRRAPSMTYHAYFDESVQGLEIGALVKYRGVKIGRVSGFEIAPDRRHVEVELSIELAAAERVGLTMSTRAVRAQLSILGITGLKIVDLDVVDPLETPLPVLPFTPEQPYLASQPSLLTGIQRGLQSSTERVPELLDKAVSAVERLDAVLEQVHSERLSKRIGAAADRLERSFATFDRVGRKLDNVLDRIGGKDGLVASARRATDSFEDTGRITRASATELGRTTRDLGDAARAVRRFFKDLERQPDMLLKGRARSR